MKRSTKKNSAFETSLIFFLANWLDHGKHKHGVRKHRIIGHDTPT